MGHQAVHKWSLNINFHTSLKKGGVQYNKNCQMDRQKSEDPRSAHKVTSHLKFVIIGGLIS